MKKNIFKKAGIGVVAMAGLALLPLLALAVGSVPTTEILTTPTQIATIIFNLLSWLGGIVMAIALIMLLYAAILFLTAGASETTHSKAKNVLIYAIVGIAVAVMAYSFQPFVTYILGWH